MVEAAENPGLLDRGASLLVAAQLVERLGPEKESHRPQARPSGQQVKCLVDRCYGLLVPAFGVQHVLREAQQQARRPRRVACLD